MRLLSPAEAADLWPRIEPILLPAIATGSRDRWAVLSAVFSGTMQCWLVTEDDDASGVIVTSVGNVKNTEILALWIVYAAGEIAGGPKERAATMRALMAEFEAKARARGCERVRVESARWGRVLPGYTRDGNILEKVL